MLKELDLSPVHAGVVYSPGGLGWRFYPEELLFVGSTGTPEAKTYVRSVLSLALPELEPEAFLLQAYLRLHLAQNEPPGVPKLVCLRETPAGATAPWTIDEELRQPVPAEHRLSSEIGVDLDFDLTGLAGAWLRGAPNNGVLLDFGTQVIGLVAFIGGNSEKPGPVLHLVYALPSTQAPTVSMEIGPDTSRDSRKFPCQELAVKNLGPGLAWITPLYCFGQDPPLDPAGIPAGILEGGGHLLLKPRLPAKAWRIRVGTALEKTRVVIIPT